MPNYSNTSPGMGQPTNGARYFGTKGTRKPIQLQHEFWSWVQLYIAPTYTELGEYAQRLVAELPPRRYFDDGPEGLIRWVSRAHPGQIEQARKLVDLYSDYVRTRGLFQVMPADRADRYMWLGGRYSRLHWVD